MIIEINELKKSYNNRDVVSIHSLSIDTGETIGLVGNNGAGKTTLFRLMLDLIRSDAGAVFSKNENVANGDHWKAYTASYLDEGFLIDYLTPEEYFEFIGSLQNFSKSDVLELLSHYKNFLMGKYQAKKNTSVIYQKEIKIRSVLLQRYFKSQKY